MVNKPRKMKRDYDRNVTAFRVVQEATKEAVEPQATPKQAPEGKNPNAVALGQRGGKARAAKLTPEQRRETGRKAAQIRWQKRP
ncbi:MAG: RNA-binding protein [Chloroflexi bacterium]|nr:RNA-binding protein [Chloroflexota bacterium]